MTVTFGVILFIAIVAVVAWRHDKKLKAKKASTPPIAHASDEFQEKHDKKHPML